MEKRAEMIIGDSKHGKIILDHLKSTSLETILIDSFKPMVSTNIIHGQPYGLIYRNILLAKLKKEIREEFEKVAGTYQPSPLKPTEPEGITSIIACDLFFGIPKVMEWIDYRKLTSLKKTLASFLREYPEDRKPNKGQYIVFDALGGSLIFKSAFLEIPESAPRPLVIYSISNISGMDIDEAANEFTDFIRSDIEDLNQEGEEFNMFVNFIVYSKVPGTENLRQEIVPTQELEDRSAILHRVRIAVKEKTPIVLKMYYRVVDEKSLIPIEYISEYEQRSEQNKEFYMQPIEKIYILHLETPKGKQSSSYIRNEALFSLLFFKGVFFTIDTAKEYARYYPENAKNPVPREFKKSILEFKSSQFVNAFRKQNIIKALWYIFEIAQLDDVPKILLHSLLQVLNSLGSKILAISKTCKTIRRTLAFFSMTNQNYYKESAEFMFRRMKPQLRELFAKGNSGDLICLRPLIETIFKDLINIEYNTELKKLESITVITASLGHSMIIQNMKHNKLVSDLITTISKKFKKPIEDVETLDTLVSKKEPEMKIHLLNELANNVKSKNYPAGKEEEYILLQYFVDTGVHENLYYIFRDLLLKATYPNALSIVEFNFLGLLNYYTFESLREKDIIKQNFPELQKCPENASNLGEAYQIYNTNMKENNLPGLFGDKSILSICSPFDIAEFTSIFRVYLMNPQLHEKLLLSVVGPCIFNNQERMKKKYRRWEVVYDILYRGTDMNSACKNAGLLMIQYLREVYEKENVLVRGFYLVEEDAQLFGITELTEEQFTEASSSLTKHLLEKNRFVLKILLPPKTKDDGYLDVVMHFNVHNYDERTNTISSTYPLSEYEDIGKIFIVSIVKICKINFDQNEYENWQNILRLSNQVENPQYLLPQINKFYANSKISDGFKLFLVKCGLENLEKDFMVELFSLLHSQAEDFQILYEECMSWKAVFEELFSFDDENLANITEVVSDPIKKLDQSIREILTKYSCAIIEGLHPKILYLMSVVKKRMSDKIFKLKKEDCNDLSFTFNILSGHFQTMSNICYLSLFEYFRKRKGLNITQEGPYLSTSG